MHFSTFLTAVGLLGTTGWAGYVLEEDYMAGGDFFSKFSFFEAEDPTHGFVEYANHETLYSCTADNARMMVDSTAVTPMGRPSIRITSNKVYESGLFILDLEHMPEGCGTWPAFWLVGPDWPNQGEIDILEGVNSQTANKVTLHTGPGCSVSDDGSFSGTMETDNCDIMASGQEENEGCGIMAQDSNTYGAGLNANGGGTYATDFTANYISVYFWPAGSAPPDVTSGSPNPSSWGKPIAHFQGDCDIGGTFNNQQIVFDTTFCGDWAGNDWSSGGCAASTGVSSCEQYVENTPEAFKNAFWSINSLKVYQGSGGSQAPSSAAPSNAPSSHAPPISQSTFQSSVIPSAPPSAPPSVPASGAPSAAPSYGPPGSASGWAPSAPITSAPAPSSPAENSGAPWSAQPTHSWGGGSPWQQSWGAYNNHHGAYVVGSPVNAAQPTDSVGEYENGHGAWSVGTPIEGDTRRARHLRHHKKRHGAGRL